VIDSEFEGGRTGMPIDGRKSGTPDPGREVRMIDERSFEES